MCAHSPSRCRCFASPSILDPNVPAVKRHALAPPAHAYVVLGQQNNCVDIIFHTACAGRCGGDARMACAVLRPQPAAAVGPQHQGAVRGSQDLNSALHADCIVHDDARAAGKKRPCTWPREKVVHSLFQLYHNSPSLTASTKACSTIVSGGAAASCGHERGGDPYYQPHHPQAGPGAGGCRRILAPRGAG